MGVVCVTRRADPRESVTVNAREASAERGEKTSKRLLVMWMGGMCEERSDELKSASSASAGKTP